MVRHAVADYYLSTEVWYSGRHYNDTLSELTRDSDPEIRRKICRDYRVSREDVKRLFADPDPKVAIETLKHRHWSYFEESLPLFYVEDDSIREEAANILLDIRPQNLGWATSFFRKLEKVLLVDPSSNVRCRLARDPWTSPSICRSLMRDKDTTVHEALLRGFQRSGECEARDFFIHNYGKNSEGVARSRNPWYSLSCQMGSP